MKRIFFFVLLSLIPGFCIAQTSRNEARCRSLRVSIEKVESRIADAEHKIILGDSLIRLGRELLADADSDFYRIAEAVKLHNKDYRVKRKKLYKLSNSKEREISVKGRAELKKLEEQHRSTMRAYTAEVREMKKKAQRGEAKICNGQRMQATAGKCLKVSEKALRQVREKYELAMSNSMN